MSVQLPQRAWVVVAVTKPDGGGELVSWHESAAEAEEKRSELDADGNARYEVQSVTRDYLEMSLSRPPR
jgi:hypothetical protein